MKPCRGKTPAAALTAGIGLLSLLVSIWLMPHTALAEARIPRLELATEDGSSSIRFRLAAQILWAYDLRDVGPSQPLEEENSIRFRRLRPVITGSVFTEAFTYLLHLNLVPGALELMDLWFNYRFHRHVEVRLGQLKIPYTRYRLGSFATRPVADWSVPNRYFGAERQIGLMLHNNVGRPGAWEYQVGIYTGVNARSSNGVGVPLTYSESRPNPSDLVDPSAPSSFHPEIVAHIAYNYNNMDVSAPQDWEGGPARFSIGASVAWDARPEAGQDLTLRFAPEVIFKVHGFTLWGVFNLGFFDELAGSERMELGMLAAVAQASYVFLDRYEVGLRYTNVTLLSAIRRDSRAFGERMIEEAEDDEERAAFEEQYAENGLLEGEHELNLGFNIYLFDTALKLQLDGGLLIHEWEDGNRYDMQIRLQGMLKF